MYDDKVEHTSGYVHVEIALIFNRMICSSALVMTT